LKIIVSGTLPFYFYKHNIMMFLSQTVFQINFLNSLIWYTKGCSNLLLVSVEKGKYKKYL
jgi:hypothetical protein